MATTVAANAVLLRAPLNPDEPALAQTTTFPRLSAMLTIVLLNDARTWATPRGALRHALRFVVAVLGPLCSRSCAMLSLSPVPGRAAYAIWPCFFIDALRFTPTVFRGPFRVRAFVLVRWPRTGSPRRCRIPR